MDSELDGHGLLVLKRDSVLNKNINFKFVIL